MMVLNCIVEILFTLFKNRIFLLFAFATVRAYQFLPYLTDPAHLMQRHLAVFNLTCSLHFQPGFARQKGNIWK
jgi:hypothetical protein